MSTPNDGGGEGNRPNNQKKKSNWNYKSNNWFRNQSTGTTVNCSYMIDENERFIERVNPNCPYKNWSYYFPDEDYKKAVATTHKVEAVFAFILKHKQQILDSKFGEKKYYCFDYKSLCESEDISEKWPSFKNDLYDSPLHSLNCMGLALNHLLNAEDAFAASALAGILKARLSSFDNLIPIKNLKAQQFGKLVVVRGTVIRVGPSRLMSSFLTFSCKSCSSLQSVYQPKGQYTVPKKCLKEACLSKSYTPCISSSFTMTRSCQTIKLQENVEGDREAGRVPRSVECELMDDLVDTCGPGDSISVIGIVQVDASDSQKKGKGTPNLFTLSLEAVSIVNSKSKVSCGRNGSLTSGIQFSLKDYYAIQEIYGEKDLFKLLVNSVCPTVYGHELVKAGILLTLMGGAGAGQGVMGGTQQRGDPHILIVGDPGLGKSHMLHASSVISPRGVYVCGNTTTGTGLTVTLSRERGGDLALEAGALVLADRGSCSIDEFDKMSSQHYALLEAMEQQCISIAKGGVVCTLPARTSIIAAANPVGGHYNRNKTVAENLNMSQPLLSRFDIVFVLLDKPNEELDCLLSDHVMSLHSGARSRPATSSSIHSTKSDLLSNSSGSPLSERLRILPGEQMELIPHALLRKYIAYARKYIPNPKLSAPAAANLQQFYLDLRKAGRDGPPVTTRQLESLIRLTLARAKSELREEATAEDANDVLDLMKASMIDTFLDEAGNLDFSRSQNGSGITGGSKVKKFISALQRKSSFEQKLTFTTAELKQLFNSLALKNAEFYSFIGTLNTQGYLLKKGNNLYKFLAEG